MATKEEQDTLRFLVQHVSRAFYEPKYTVVMDQLARHPVLKDDDLAGRIGLQVKELNKLLAVLSTDCLVRVYRQNELKEGAQRSVGKQYYYIDYQHFCNVVKWRIAEMRRIIDSSLRNELDNKGYICPQCDKSFSPLEVDKLMDFAAGCFLCDVCHAELVDNENAESLKGSQDRMQRFNRQMRFIREGLQKTEKMVMPAFDVALYVKQHLVGGDSDRQKGAGGAGPSDERELKIAGMGGAKREDEGIGIVMSLDVDEETRRMERSKEAAAKKQQNALPTWHLKSTISGDLTALGVAETARAAAANAMTPSSSNDEILKGLGTVRPAQVPVEASLMTIVEDVKPVTDAEGDYYDQYYASLAASAQDTPGLSMGSDFGEEEEEDVKPSIEYLNSLNDYRKRGRSEDEAAADRAKKVPRTVNADGLLDVDEEEMEGVHVDGVAKSGTDDPLVYVNGTAMAFSQVTEEHQDLMTPEEYTSYYELISARS